MKKSSAILISVLLTAMVTFSLTITGISLWNGSLSDGMSNRIGEIRTLIDRNAVFEFSQEDAEIGAIRGYLSGLDDDYAQYWTEEEYKALLSSKQGNVSGIGLSLLATRILEEGIFVRRVLGNSPAEESGIKAGDRITAIDGVSVLGRDYNQVFSEMEREVGESIALTLARGEDTISVSVTFADFVQTYVSYRMIDDVGFIRIDSFTEPAANEFQIALNALLKDGAKGLIFDLRNNPGGSINAVKQILEPLIPKGEEMVIIKYKNSEEIIYSKLDQKTDLPMVVLLNASSASGSELMASCLRDLNGAILMGNRSFGKGIGQTTYRLSDGSAVRITNFHYLTKARIDYHGIGLQPDETITLTEEQDLYFYALDESNDPQLQGALTRIHAEISGK
ncbi:MAG: PDZ domain-containing protein [Clostridia bacterium]|nr:PDZ domain-containing protein [Clostridia bacterium]